MPKNTHEQAVSERSKTESQVTGSNNFILHKDFTADELKNISDASKNWSVTPPSVNLVVESRPSLIEKFTVENSGLKVYADMSNIFITPVVLPVRSEIISDDAFRIIRIEPNNITVSMNE